jgi:Flp pilus assembly pilin Flp
MFFLLKKGWKKRVRRARGQGISEYGAMLAFVAVLVALCFSIANGHLAAAVSTAFSAVSGQLNGLSGQAGSSS